MRSDGRGYSLNAYMMLPLEPLSVHGHFISIDSSLLYNAYDDPVLLRKHALSYYNSAASQLIQPLVKA